MAELRLQRTKAWDIDLIVAENIVKNPEFARLFLGEEGGTLELLSLKLWQDDGYGKPDLTAVFRTETDRVMLLLADTVMKMTRKKNQETLENEGEKHKEKGECDRYRCCILAPRIDLEANSEELEGFPTVSYEQVKEALQDDPWAEYVLYRGIADRPQAFSEKKYTAVTAFGDSYYNHVKKYYPDLSMKKMNKNHGISSIKVQFSTDARVTICHKPSDGVVDMKTSLGQYDYSYFEETISPLLYKGMKIRHDRKDAVIYMDVPAVDFEGDFDEQLDSLNTALEAVVQIQKFIEETDYDGIEQILEDGLPENKTSIREFDANTESGENDEP